MIVFDNGDARSVYTVAMVSNRKLSNGNISTSTDKICILHIVSINLSVI